MSCNKFRDYRETNQIWEALSCCRRLQPFRLGINKAKAPDWCLRLLCSLVFINLKTLVAAIFLVLICRRQHRPHGDLASIRTALDISIVLFPLPTLPPPVLGVQSQSRCSETVYWLFLLTLFYQHSREPIPPCLFVFVFVILTQAELTEPGRVWGRLLQDSGLAFNYWGLLFPLPLN